ncbi:SGNH hydrolase [Trametes elegans]|nr:SGNH hydrolase [Trametes elegans]
MALANVQDAIVLLGDSLAEFSYGSNGVAARLSEKYVRKLDVINRGFSGYNTDWILPVFEQIWATRDEQAHAQKVQLLIIWFGANDAAEPANTHHVPVERYQANLTALVRAVRAPDSPRYSPDTRVLLVTPPPVETRRWGRLYAELYNPAADPNKPNRSLEVSGVYAEAMKEVGQKEGVPVIDVWRKLWDTAGRVEEKLEPFLLDGLHLTASGYEVVYDAIIAGIAEHYPELHYDRLQTVFSTFDVLAADPKNHANLTKKRSAFAK